MHIYLKNNPVKLHPDPIRKDGAQAFLNMVAPTRRYQLLKTMVQKLREELIIGIYSDIMAKHAFNSSGLN